MTHVGAQHGLVQAPAASHRRARLPRGRRPEDRVDGGPLLEGHHGPGPHEGRAFVHQEARPERSRHADQAAGPREARIQHLLFEGGGGCEQCEREEHFVSALQVQHEQGASGVCEHDQQQGVVPGQVQHTGAPGRQGDRGCGGEALGLCGPENHGAPPGPALHGLRVGRGQQTAVRADLQGRDGLGVRRVQPLHPPPGPVLGGGGLPQHHQVVGRAEHHCSAAEATIAARGVLLGARGRGILLGQVVHAALPHPAHVEAQHPLRIEPVVGVVPPRPGHLLGTQQSRLLHPAGQQALGRRRGLALLRGPRLLPALASPLRTPFLDVRQSHGGLQGLHGHWDLLGHWGRTRPEGEVQGTQLGGRRQVRGREARQTLQPAAQHQVAAAVL
mmetsp:Transcript_29256/g.40191  ORF Transcript_29256/g.40191 Transcript_29256/m.40191 type:complete len:387 (-) Transcript_29256:590-1750(-)